eukprot:741261-Amphidinium_carterae.1
MTAEKRQMEQTVRQPWLKETGGDSRAKVTLVLAVAAQRQNSEEKVRMFMDRVRIARAKR